MRLWPSRRSSYRSLMCLWACGTGAVSATGSPEPPTGPGPQGAHRLRPLRIQRHLPLPSSATGQVRRDQESPEGEEEETGGSETENHRLEMKGELPGLRDPEGTGGAAPASAALPQVHTQAPTLMRCLLTHLVKVFFCTRSRSSARDKAQSPGAGRSPSAPRRRPPCRSRRPGASTRPAETTGPRPSQPCPGREESRRPNQVPGAHCSIPPLSPDRDGRAQSGQPRPDPRARAQSQSAQVPACPVRPHTRFPDT